MASNRSRGNRSIANRVNQIDTLLDTERKSTATPHLFTGDIQAGHLATNSVTTDALASNSVTSDQISRGAVGTENLGVVNKISSDGNMVLNVGGTGNLIIDGVKYESPYDNLADLSTLYTIGFDPSTNGLKIFPAPPSTGGGGGNVTVSATAPLGASEGDIWVYDVDGSTYVYYTDGSSNQWIEIGAQTTPFYPPVAFVDVSSVSLSATVTRVTLTATTPRFVHSEIIASTTTHSFQVTKAGYYEFGFEGAATSVESGNRVTVQAYLSTTTPPATAPASTYRDTRTFDSAVAAGTIAVNGRWFGYVTPTDYVAFYVSCNATDGSLSTNSQVFIRRIA